MTGNNHYSTPDTALASYLISEGYPTPTIELTHDFRFPDSIRAVFVFDSDPRIQDYIHQWQSGKAQGNLCVFHDINRKLVSLVKTKIKLAQS